MVGAFQWAALVLLPHRDRGWRPCVATGHHITVNLPLKAFVIFPYSVQASPRPGTHTRFPFSSPASPLTTQMRGQEERGIIFSFGKSHILQFYLRVKRKKADEHLISLERRAYFLYSTVYVKSHFPELSHSFWWQPLEHHSDHIPLSFLPPTTHPKSPLFSSAPELACTSCLAQSPSDANLCQFQRLFSQNSSCVVVYSKAFWDV